MRTYLNHKEKLALRAYALTNGKHWKSCLWADWNRDAVPPVLLDLRDWFGPPGLCRLSLSDLSLEGIPPHEYTRDIIETMSKRNCLPAPYLLTREQMSWAYPNNSKWLSGPGCWHEACIRSALNTTAVYKSVPIEVLRDYPESLAFAVELANEVADKLLRKSAEKLESRQLAKQLEEEKACA